MPDRRPAVARRLLRRRHRGRAHRRHLPDAGDPADRRLPRQRLRALAHPRARRAAAIDPGFATEPNHDSGETRSSSPTRATPRPWRAPWAIPGTPGLEHRIGGLEKDDDTATSSYDPANHERMVRTAPGQGRRHRRLDCRRSRSTTPTATPRCSSSGGASTYGPIGSRRTPRAQGRLHVAHVHLRYLNPFPNDLGDVLKRYDKVLVPEMNMGQLSLLLRAKYLVDASASTRSRASRSRRPSWPTSSATWSPRRRASTSTSPRDHPGGAAMTERHRPGRPAPCAPAPSPVPTSRRAPDGQGFRHRPGGALVPGLRRLRHPAQVQKVLPDLGIPRENIVFVSGIGCSRRFPYYMNTYGFHSIHGRAPAIATGRQAAQPGPVGVGRHRRRRRPVDRRQPPASTSCAATST